jgi:hypothetical protein
VTERTETHRADRLGIALGVVFCLLSAAPAVAVLTLAGLDVWRGLLELFARHHQWHLVLALCVLLAAPLIQIAGLLLTWRTRGSVWLFVAGVLISVVTVCLLVPRWPHIVSATAWSLLAVGAAIGLAATYLLVQRAYRVAI